ncbi:GNAT family N-acetyltransferase [Egibacter rhizosphaerae]|uniref:GNAT family N-acetyltransferase n=1 Tax=Egibacter rhizosphaerae TaxID=1670831 RepID=A0A411YDY1_9ACTN|nr:GNAT family N-acetyltransferase [Egibacter rhizosphaerae]QBI19453.1 GNAT family N-acetyltransferase [Egibacter rhizosphaerae]
MRTMIGLAPGSTPGSPARDTAPDRPERAHRAAVRLEPRHLDSCLHNRTSAFGTAPETESERIERQLADGELWGLVDGDTVLAQARLVPTFHRLGGRPVPCLGLAGVAVPPEQRRHGYAATLVRDVTVLGAVEGFGASVLYPATTAFYRALGWEHAGTRSRYRVLTRAATTRGPTMRLADRPTDWAALQRCRERSVADVAGTAVRPPDRWQQLADARYRYALDDPEQPGELRAYALVDHEHEPTDWQFRLRLRDWAATDRGGLDAVVALVGQSDSIARAAVFVDTTPARWSAVLPEQELEIAGQLHWMARGLDLPAAIGARGFPAGLALAVTLQVEDEPALEEVVPSGPWRLEVAGGEGRLVDVPGADVRLAPQAVGPLITGFRSASDLRMLGLVRGPSDSLELLDAAFAGSSPSMIDFF